MSREQGKENIKMKPCVGHYKRKLCHLSEKLKEQRAYQSGQMFELHMMSGSLRHVTHTTVSEKEEHLACAEVRHCWVTPVGNWLKPAVMAGADEEAGSSAQEVSISIGCSQQ